MITEPVQLPLPFIPGLSQSQRADLQTVITDRWTDDAACRRTRQPNVWFAEPENADTAADAVHVCRSCPVARACLATALLGEEEGIWGGTTEDQRADLLELLGSGVGVTAVLSIATDQATLAA